MYAGYAGRREQTGGSSVHLTMFVVILITALITVRRPMWINIPSKPLLHPQRLFGELLDLGLIYGTSFETMRHLVVNLSPVRKH